VYWLKACLLAVAVAAAPLAGMAQQKAPSRVHRAIPSHAHTHPRVRAHAAAAAAAAEESAPLSSISTARQRELETLARQLRDPSRVVAYRAYLRLAALSRHWPGVARSRAALALGYYEYQRRSYAQARRWFRAGRGDPVLEGYAIYWEGLAAAAAGQDADAMDLLSEYRQEFPGSVMDRPALEAYADAAIDGMQPDRVLAALRGYPDLQKSPGLLLRLALAEERSGDPMAASRDFQRVYDYFPLDNQSAVAAKGIERMRAALGANFPEAPVADRMARAELLYQTGQWPDAKQAWESLLDSLTGTDGERAALRIAQCDSRITHQAGALETLTLPDPALDAERWISLLDVYRLRTDREDQMKAVLAKVVQLVAAGAPAEMADHALFIMANYYWANLNWDQAVPYYRQYLAREVSGPDADTADWRIAWTAYFENSPAAQTLLRSHIERFPDSPYVPDALYWLGRLAENAGNASLARAYYEKDSSRFAETYFGRLARDRASRLVAQSDPAVALPLLDRIPPLPPAQPLDDEIPSSVREQYDRATALDSIGFDDSAMLEFRQAYLASQAPELLVAAARAAQAAKHYLTGAALVRELVPDLESRPMDSVPESIWRIVYPLPIASLVDFYAVHEHFDPMLFAALIRQESGFQADALSSAGAVGLAQLEPYTARKWSRVLHLRYSYKRLTDPRYNLRVSAAYFHSLIVMFGSVELAVAAYNAGEDRVASWESQHHYDDPAEFVESIPFSQTRHYAEVVLSGAAIYRRLYEDPR
jgi:soluble lytic murein transglycosylase